MGRTNGTGIHIDDEANAQYDNVQGNFFFASEDHDGVILGPAQLDFEQISIFGANTLTFSIWAAAGSSGSGSPNYEADDYLRVFVDFDGAGTFTTQVFGFETPLAVGANQSILLDTDFDGRGDGTLLNDVFQQFTFVLPNPGASTAQFRLEWDGGATSEEFAFDNLELRVDVIPEPSVAALLGLVVGAACLRRRRS